MTVKLRPLRRSRTQLRCTRSGSRVLIHSGGVPDTALFDFVRWCAVEPGYTVVAVCVPPETAPEALEDVVGDLAGCPGVLRLIPARLGIDSTLEYGDWLARRLGRPVIAHEGPVTIVPSGGLYVAPGEGAGWLGFTPGAAPLPHSRRFPRPSWDCAPFAEPRGFGPQAALDPLPAGVWIRPAEESADVLAFRRWLIGNVPADPLLPRVVLGYPGAPMPPIDAVAEFWRSLPGALQPAVRFAGFGGTDDGMALYGQTLADALDTPVVLADGVQLAEPSPGGGFELRTVLRRGVMTWSPYVGDLGYLPARSTGGLPGDPVIIGHRAPIAGLREREPGVYEYSHDAVLEVTQNGLWMRPHILPSDSFMVRAEQADPTFTMVVFDASNRAGAHRMQLLATEMVERLEPSVRSVARILPSTATGTARRAQAQLASSVAVLDPPQQSAAAAVLLGDAPAASSAGSETAAAPVSAPAGESVPALAPTEIRDVAAMDAAAGMTTLHVPIATLLASLQDGSDPADGRWRARLGGALPELPTASEPAVDGPVSWTEEYDEAPVPPAIALYALSWPAPDAEGMESEPDLVSRTVAEVRQAPAAAVVRPVVGGEPTETFPAITDEMLGVADAIAAARSVPSAEPAVNARPTLLSSAPGIAAASVVEPGSPMLSAGPIEQAPPASSGPAPAEASSSPVPPAAALDPRAVQPPAPANRPSATAQRADEAGNQLSTTSQRPDGSGDRPSATSQRAEEIGSRPSATSQHADGSGGRPSATSQRAEEPDEPIQYGAFQLVSSGADLSFSAPSAPEVPAGREPGHAASTAAEARTRAPGPAPSPPAAPSNTAVPATPAAPATRQAPSAPAQSTPAVQAPQPAPSPAPVPRPAADPEPPAPVQAPVPAEPAERASTAAAEQTRPEPTQAEPAGAAPAKRPAERRTAKSSVRVQPVPTAQCSVLPREGGLQKERDWLRRNLSKQYDATASSVARLMSEYPGLRAGSSASDTDVLTDLVALRLYLTGKIGGLDDAVRAGKVGPHVPLARCVASGLRRLPSYRGPLRTRASLTEEQVRWYGARGLVTEWSFLPAVASGELELPGTAEILIWSMSARRTGLLDPSRPDQVVFQPGTSFKVLGAEAGEEGPRIRLRELTRTEVAPDGTVQSVPALDEFAVSVLEEAGKAWRQEDPVQRLPADRQDWFASPPGLLAHPARVGATGSAQEGVRA